MAGTTVRIAILAQAAKAKAEFKDLADKASTAADRVKKSWDGVGDRTKGALAAGGAAAGAALVAGVTGALGQADITAQLETQLGTSTSRAGELGKIAGKVYAGNFGTDLGQVGEAVKRVQQDIGDLGAGASGGIEGLTQKTLTLSQAFGTDLGGTTAAVGQLLRTGLAANADEAFDILTKGFQGGADKAGDLLDTFTEYGTQFRKFGLDGATATGLLTQGLQAGARDADTVADAIKEFAIRGIDGSKATAEGFKALGLDAKKMAADIAAGGPKSAAALDLTLDRLRGIKDPAARSAAAVQLFGTKAEDLGDALYALDPSEAAAGLGQVAGAAQKAVDSMGATPSAKIETFKRSLQQGFTGIVGNLAGFATANSSWLVPLIGTLGGIAAVIYTVNLATKVWAATQAAITAVTKAWKVAQLALNATFLANPVFLIIAGVVALVAAIILAYKKSETFRAVVQAVWSAIKAAIGAVIDWFTANVPKLWEKAKEVWDGIKSAAETAWNAIKAATSTAWNAIKTVVNVVIAGITAYINAYKAVVLAVWNAIKVAATAAWNLIKAAVQAVISVLTFIVDGWRKVILAVWDGIRVAATTAWNAIKKVISDSINTAKDTVSSVVGKIKALFSPSTLYNAGRELITGLVNGIGDRIGAAIEKVRAGVNKIKGLLPGSPIKWGPLTSWNNGGAGKRLMGLLEDGIRSGAPGVSAALSDGLAADARIGIAPAAGAQTRGAVTIGQLSVNVGGSLDLSSPAARKAAAEAMAREIQEALVAYEGGRR